MTESKPWGVVLLAPPEPGRRNRRTLDGVLAATSALLGALAAVFARSAPTTDEDIGEAVAIVLGWAPGFWRAALAGALVLALVVVAEALVRRRWLLVRDLLIALVVAGALTIVLARLGDAEWLPIDVHPLSTWGFPEFRLAFVVAVIAVARPELVRPARIIAFALAGLASLGALALEIAVPSGVLGGLAVGLGAGALVRLAFGSPLGVPPLARVRTALGALGVVVRDLRIAERQRIGAADYFGQDDDGRDVKVRVLGRDAQDTQRVARRWRLLAIATRCEARRSGGWNRSSTRR